MEAHQRVDHSDFDRPAISVIQSWSLPRPGRLYRRAGKRLLDVTLVLLSLPIVLPVVLLLALVIRLGGQSPLYRQPRIGRGGQIFTLWKLRTMVDDADARLGEHLAKDPFARREWDAYQKLTHDPRITMIGGLLRKSSLDELPQLWNVLVGDMSLVGPRPMLLDQQDLYPGSAYYALRPGITGTWQVSERNASTFVQRAEFDADYERNLSFANDFKVLLATVGVVLRATGK